MKLCFSIFTVIFLIACSGGTSAKQDKINKSKKFLFSVNLDTIISYNSSTEKLKSNHIPDSVFLMTNLKYLSIQGMDCDYRMSDKDGNDITQCWMLTEIPHQIINLKKLEKIQLNVNAIRAIPIELADLKSLKSLDLTDNSNLSDIENIIRLENLESLGLNGCYLTRLPTNIGQLKKLKSLGLAGNNIDEQEKARIKKALPDCEIYF